MMMALFQLLVFFVGILSIVVSVQIWRRGGLGKTVLPERELTVMRSIGKRILKRIGALYGIATIVIMIAGYTRVKGLPTGELFGELRDLFWSWTVGFGYQALMLGSIAYALIGSSTAFRTLLIRFLGKEYTLPRLVSMGNKAVPILIEALQSSPRFSLITILPVASTDRILNSSAYQTTISNQAPPGNTIRHLAAEGLGRLKSAEGIDPLVRVLDEPDIELRGKVIRALGEIGDQRAVPAIFPFLGEEQQREGATHALVKLGYEAPLAAFHGALRGRMDWSAPMRKETDRKSSKPFPGH